jgi:hypothetical protein
MAVNFEMDFTPLGKLGQVYQQAREREQTQQWLQQQGLPGNMNLAQLALQQQAQARSQGNADRTFGLEERKLAATLEGGKVPPGFRQAPGGGLAPIPGGPADPAYKRTVTDKQNAPAGYKWKDANNPDAGLVAILGGPGEKITAEVAARLGLAKSFLGQLEDTTDAQGNVVKGIRTRVKEGQATGLWDGAMGAANVGESGELRRQIASGAEALLRNLTGAGMNIDEAKRYVSRYEPQWNDKAETVISKLAQLERELRSVNDVVSQGRGGSVLEKPGAVPQSVGPQPPAAPTPAQPSPQAFNWKTRETIMGARQNPQQAVAQAQAAVAKGMPAAEAIQRLRAVGIPADPSMFGGGASSPAMQPGSAGAIY